MRLWTSLGDTFRIIETLGSNSTKLQHGAMVYRHTYTSLSWLEANAHYEELL